MSDTLTPGHQLAVNDEITSAHGKTALILQGDGNVVLYRADLGWPLWALHTPGTSPTRATMQSDGTVYYDSRGHAEWSPGTDRAPPGAGVRIVAQDDGNLVV